jgi:citrate lyase subunit beta/citryl-CoA lyase
MTTVVGHAGESVRADVRVTVSDAPKPETDIRSSVGAIYNRSIRDLLQQVLTDFGNPNLSIALEDSGALPFVLQARIEAALCKHLQQPLPPLPKRKTSPVRDRLRRTRLYVPGDVPKLFANAGLYEPDILLLDLEDSVPPESKFAARAAVRRALNALDWDACERMVRINSGPQGLEDIRALADQGVDAFFVPKAEDAEQMREIGSVLEQVECNALLVPLIETAKGVMNAATIASASPRVAALAIGLEDYTADIGAERSESGEESAWAMGQLLNSARAAGIQPLASVFPDVESADGMFAYATRARKMGFEGVGCIHPRQIRPAHDAFTPSADEMEHASAIVTGFEQALADGLGAVRVNGKMIDAPVYERARRTLSRGRPS